MKKIKWANVEFLSLCPRGKNGLKVLYKEDGTFEAGALIKKGAEFEKDGEIVAAIYIPNHPDHDEHVAQDAFAIKTMAYSHSRNGSKLDLRHDEQALTKDQAYMAESFIIQEGDPRFADLKDEAGHAVDPTGGWGCVIKLEDDELKSKYEFDGWQGVSLFGQAMVQTMKSDEERVIDRLTSNRKEKARMDEEKIMQLINKALEPIQGALAKLTDVKKEAPETQEPEAPKPPEFKGDPTKKEDVEKFQKELKKFELMQSVDWSDSEAVDKILADLEKEAEDNTDGESEEKENLSKEAKDKIARLEDKLAKLKKGSKQPVGDGDNKDEGLTEDERLFKIGKEAATFVNGGGEKK